MTTGIKVNGKELTPKEAMEMAKNNLKRLHKIEYKTGGHLDEIEAYKHLMNRMQKKIKIQQIEEKMSKFCSNKEYDKLLKQWMKLKNS